MTQWVHLWYSCVVGKGVIYTRSHDTSSHHIGTYLELSGRTGTGDLRAVREAGVIPVSQSPEPGWWENIPRLRDGWWGGGTGRCRVTAGCCLTWWLTTSVGTKHRSREHQRDRENVTRDRDGERARDKWDYKDRAVYTCTVTTKHRMVWKVSHNNVIIVIYSWNSILPYNLPLTLSKFTSFKPATTAVLWGSFSRL